MQTKHHKQEVNTDTSQVTGPCLSSGSDGEHIRRLQYTPDNLLIDGWLFSTFIANTILLVKLSSRAQK